MFLKSLIFSFCFLYLSSSSRATEDLGEYVRIPKTLFNELMNKRDEELTESLNKGDDDDLILKTDDASSEKSPMLKRIEKEFKRSADKVVPKLQDFVNKKKERLDHVLQKIKNWETEVKDEAKIEENLSSLKKVAKEFRRSGKQIFNASKLVGKEIINIGSKIVKAAFRTV